jgi:hypothetical protein
MPTAPLNVASSTSLRVGCVWVCKRQDGHRKLAEEVLTADIMCVLAYHHGDLLDGGASSHGVGAFLNQVCGMETDDMHTHDRASIFIE